VIAVAAVMNQGKASIDNEMEIKEEYVLDRVVLLDWAMDHWKPILTSVRKILLAEHLIQSMEMATCDVRVPLSQQPNVKEQHDDHHVLNNVSIQPCSDDVLSLLTWSHSQESVVASRVNESRLEVDMVVISYLLSETRGQWHHFLDELVRFSSPGTVFLLTDPTAWQLHAFRRRYEFSCTPGQSDSTKQFHFVWLDSSMHRPELQVLEGRIGPAILMGIKLEPPIDAGGH
jgi:hypothetical protein